MKFVGFFFTNIECSYEKFFAFALAMKNRRLILWVKRECVIIDYCSSNNLSFKPSVYRSVHINIPFEMLDKKALEDFNDMYP